ncbi:MAG: DUF3127 domain-containing protein [Cytophagales bacterium]|nr:MAG: DUF3127 domain-containing protein [Cytophagales bacterium]TAF59649.1 MAG: DUF3127 domain-containing protein [Cytophagales bacterium]
MSSFEVAGKLTVKFAAQQVSEKFRKREFVLEVPDGQYSQHIKFQLTQDRCEVIDAFKENDTVRVSFNLRGRPYQSKTGETVYFTNLEAWRVTAETSASAGGNTSAPSHFDSVPLPNDDLPFF